MSKLRVVALVGEPTRYHVEGYSLECTGCGKLFQRHRTVKWKGLKIGDPCPHCAATLDCRFHLCDIAAYEGVGQCDCEFFRFNIEPKLCRMTLAEQRESKKRCSHLEAAREVALDITLRHYEEQRRKKACNKQPACA